MTKCSSKIHSLSDGKCRGGYWVSPCYRLDPNPQHFTPLNEFKNQSPTDDANANAGCWVGRTPAIGSPSSFSRLALGSKRHRLRASSSDTTSKRQMEQYRPLAAGENQSRPLHILNWYLTSIWIVFWQAIQIDAISNKWFLLHYWGLYNLIDNSFGLKF